MRVESESGLRKVVRSEVIRLLRIVPINTIAVSVIQKLCDSICQSFYDSIKDSNSIWNKEFLVLQCSRQTVREKETRQPTQTI